MENTWKKITKITSSDKNVTKFVFENDDAVAESVLYKYPNYQDRTVICCSTQSGCPVGCRFCGAGDNFVRSLTAEEIIDQVTYLLEGQIKCMPHVIKKLQIMLMSMGEPMLNWKKLKLALNSLSGLYPNAKLLISTSGPDVDYADMIKTSKKISAIGLQFSLHESTDEARDKLIPMKKKLSIKRIANIGEKWFRATGRKPFFNYCAHPENVSSKDVSRIRKLFDPTIWEATVSVICERDENVSAANERQRGLALKFVTFFICSGYSVRMFNPGGQDDIGGGCGQLWFVQKWMKDNPEKVKRSTGYGKDVVHTPTVS